MDTTILEQRPIRATLAGGVLLLGVGLTLFGLTLPLLGWIGIWTSQLNTLPATSLASIVAIKDMLTYAGSLVAITGVPIMLLGMVLVALVWLL
jgi:hypothetical protein